MLLPASLFPLWRRTRNSVMGRLARLLVPSASPAAAAAFFTNRRRWVVLRPIQHRRQPEENTQSGLRRLYKLEKWARICVNHAVAMWDKAAAG